MPGSTWSRPHVLCPLFNYCQIKPPDCDTSQHFLRGQPTSRTHPESQRMQTAHSPAPCAQPRAGPHPGTVPNSTSPAPQFYGIHSLALNTPCHLTFAHCDCKLPSTPGEPRLRNHKGTFYHVWVEPQETLQCSGPATGQRLIRTWGSQGPPPPPAQNPAIHLDSHAQPPSTPCSTCSHRQLGLPPPP